MKKIVVLAAMAAALTVAAEMKIGTVNMVDLVRLHPNHESNRALVKTTDSEYKAKLDAKQDELKEIADEGKKSQSDLQNPMLSTQARAAAQKKLEPFVFTTQWTAQAQFAGYYVAQEKPRRCSAPGPPSAAR